MNRIAVIGTTGSGKSTLARQLTTRTLNRIATQQSVCNGNFKTHWKRRREMPLVLAEPEHQHLSLVRLRSPRDANEWLAMV